MTIIFQIMYLLFALLLAVIVLSAWLNIRKRGWRTYVMGVLMALDEMGNALLGGDHDETISSRCERGYRRYWYWTLLGRILNAIDPGHIQIQPR